MEKTEQLKSEFNAAVAAAVASAADVYADSVRREIHANYEAIIEERRAQCEKLQQQLESANRTACRLIHDLHVSRTLISSVKSHLVTALNTGLHASRGNLEALLQYLNTSDGDRAEELPGLIPFLIIHTHRHGLDTHFVLSHVNLGDTAALEDRASAKGIPFEVYLSELYAEADIDFEPEREETIECVRLDLVTLDVSQWSVIAKPA